MKPWLLEPIEGLGNDKDDSSPWRRSLRNTTLAFVIWAEDEAEARSMAGESAGAEGAAAWASKELSTCRLLDE